MLAIAGDCVAGGGPYGNAITAQTFRFDAKDNITHVLTTFPGGSNTATYLYENTDPVQLSKVTNSNPAANYPAVINLEYDGNGNLVKDERGRVLEYDALNRLLSVSALPGDKDASYRYDPLNVLAGSDVKGHPEQRFYQNDELASLINGSNSSSFMRGDGVVLAEHQAGDDPKSLMVAVDQKNTVTNEVNGGAFTNIAYSVYGYSSAGQPVKAQLGYNGEFTERKTGLQLLGNGYRAYSSVLMRFYSVDDKSPYGDGGLNGYAAFEGDPITYSDPSGHSIFSRFFRFVTGRTKAPGSRVVTKPTKMGGSASNLPVGGHAEQPSGSGKPRTQTARAQNDPANGRNSPEGHVYEKIKPVRKPGRELTAAEKQKRKEDRYLSNRLKRPEEAKQADRISRPNVVVGKDAGGRDIKTTNLKIGFDTEFGTDIYQRVVVPREIQKMIRYS